VPAPVVGPLFGVATETFSEVAKFDQQSGKATNIYSYYKSFFWDAAFDTSLANQVHAAGKTNMITWEPWEPNGVAVQPQYSLARFNSGAFDVIIKNWAASIKALGFPIYLRFAHEMNGDWYPWGNTNGNKPGDYIAAWRRVRLLFTAAGVTNVFWVWSPNVDFPVNPYYPGDAQVDWIAVDGYNWDTSSPEQVFGATLDQIKALAPTKPVMIGETGCPEYSGKPAWIKAFFAMIKARKISAFVWFNYNKEQNWRTDSSTAALAAFKTGVNSS
jgi:beta-mannanase